MAAAMKTDQALSQRWGLPLVLAIALVLLVGVAGAAWWFQTKAEASIGLRKHISTVRFELASLKSDVMELSRGLRGYAISGQDDWLEPYREARRDSMERLIRLKVLTVNSPLQQRRLEDFGMLLDTWIGNSFKALQLAKSKNLDDIRHYIATGDNRNLINRMELLLHTMDAEEMRQFQLHDAAADSNQSTDNQITLGGALLALVLIAWAAWMLKVNRASLQAAGKVTAEQDWLKSNLTQLMRMMQGQRDLRKVGEQLLDQLATLVNAQHGVFYRMNDEGKRLSLLASYAYRESANLPKTFSLGEGIVGQAALKKERMVLTQVPANYIQINSGLGAAAPLNIVVLPVVFENDVKGVLELSSFHSYSKIQLALLDELSGSIGTVFNNISSATRTESMLLKSQAMTTALKEQQQLKLANQALVLRQQRTEEQREIVDAKNRELEKVQTELAEHAEQLTRATRYKSEFLANMSHELRTPLNGIMLLTRIMAQNREGNLSAGQLEYLQNINGGGMELLTLIDDILDLSKIEAGRIELSPDTIQLSELRDFAESAFRPSAEDKRIEFSVDLAPGLPEALHTDQQRIKQVLRNLLSNAFKFTENGRISLAIARPAPGTQFQNPSLSQASGIIVFAVADTGIGIPPEKQTLIWESFQQEDSSTSRKYGGTGLGLSISREIAQLLGGEIHLQSEPGQGSTFTLYLPEQGIPATTPTRPAPDDISDDISDDRADCQPGDRIALIVENDRLFATLLRDQSREHGFKVVITMRGDTGMELLRTLTPDVLLLNLGLPGLPGEYLFNEIRNNPRLARTRVAVISGKEDVDPEIAAKAFAYLKKPISLEKLQATLDRLLESVSNLPRRVLVVEDIALEREELLRDLAGAGREVRGAATGEQALAALRTEPFHCMLLDLSLPDMPGETLLERMHTELGLRNLAVLVHTARDLTPQEEARLASATLGIIHKRPHSSDRVRAQLSQLLAVHAAAPHVKLTPQTPVAANALLTLPEVVGSTLSGRTVLLVDDKQTNLFALRKALELDGIKVILAENGQESLDQLRAHPEVDAVLMDMMMPVMDGFEATRRIRQEPAWAKLPVIAVTARVMKGDRECMAEGAR